LSTLNQISLSREKLENISKSGIFMKIKNSSEGNSSPERYFNELQKHKRASGYRSFQINISNLLVGSGNPINL
jgi:hypothetical protein